MSENNSWWDNFTDFATSTFDKYIDYDLAKSNGFGGGIGGGQAEPVYEPSPAYDKWYGLNTSGNKEIFLGLSGAQIAGIVLVGVAGVALAKAL